MKAEDKLQAAHNAYKAKDYGLAISEAQAALKLDAKAHKAYQIMSRASADLGDFGSAVTFIEEALKIAPRDAECLGIYGSLLIPFSRDFDAIEAFKSALEIAPNYLPPALGLGQLYLARKNPIKAADVFQTALVHLPDHPLLLKGLLYALNDAQQFDIASDLLGKLPASPDTALIAGAIALARRQKPVAEAHFVQALSHPPSSLEAFRNLVQMSWSHEDGGVTAAAALINSFLSDNPDAGGFYLYGSDLMCEMEEYQAALDLIDMAEKKFGESPDTKFLKAKALIAAGRAEEAYANADRALKARPDNLSILSEFTRAALMTGRAELALQASQAAQLRQPKNLFWLAAGAAAFRALGRDEEYSRLYNYDLVKAYDIETPPEYDTQLEFLSELKQALMKHHEHKVYALEHSLRGGSQSPSDLRFADDRVVQDFFQAVTTSINDYISSLPDDEGHPLCGRKRKSYRLSGAWSVHLEGEGFHLNHIHKDGWISAAFYVDAPDGTQARKDKAGWIAFGKPPFTVAGPNGRPLGAEHMMAPAPGRLLLFPSYMWHGTVPLPEGDDSRLTLSFNIAPA